MYIPRRMEYNFHTWAGVPDREQVQMDVFISSNKDIKIFDLLDHCCHGFLCRFLNKMRWGIFLENRILLRITRLPFGVHWFVAYWS